MKTIGIIGGSGLEKLNLLPSYEEKHLETPWGEPSSSLIKGVHGDIEVCILSRHGRRHKIPPHKVNNRANLWALKEMGASEIVATTACGSLREQIGRGDLLIPDQFIDFTRRRELTFFDKFENGELHHVSMGDPFDPGLRNRLISTSESARIPIHHEATIITIEGPRFSTRAESRMYRNWGADLVNMSTAPEAILARELELPYAVIAMSTDYDAWKDDENAVTWEQVLEVFKANTERLTDLLYAFLAG